MITKWQRDLIRLPFVIMGLLLGAVLGVVGTEYAEYWIVVHDTTLRSESVRLEQPASLEKRDQLHSVRNLLVQKTHVQDRYAVSFADTGDLTHARYE